MLYGEHSLLAPAQLRQVRKLLDPYDGVVERRLEALGHGVGQNHGDHHGQDVWDLTGQLKDDHRRGHGVCDCSGERRSTWNTHTRVKLPRKPRAVFPVYSISCTFFQINKQISGHNIKNEWINSINKNSNPFIWTIKYKLITDENIFHKQNNKNHNKCLIKERFTE